MTKTHYDVALAEVSSSAATEPTIPSASLPSLLRAQLTAAAATTRTSIHSTEYSFSTGALQQYYELQQLAGNNLIVNTDAGRTKLGPEPRETIQQ